MFKVKTRSQIKKKKPFAYYIVRRVNNLWEMRSPFHAVQGTSLDECAVAILAMEKKDSGTVKAPRKPSIKMPKKAKRKSK